MYYTAHFETMNHDTDANGIVRPSIILRYMQETANHQMRDCKPTYDELFADGKAFILSRMTVKVNRIIKAYENIEVQTWPCPGKGATFLRCYVITANGEEIARGLGHWALVDINTKGLLRSGDVDLSNYTYGEPFEMSGVRFRIPSDEMQAVGSYRVHYPLIDCNRHMNNTNYPDMFFSFIPDVDKRYVTDFSITYRTEAPLDAELKVEISEPHVEGNGTVTYFFRTYTSDKINSEAFMTLKSIE